jgi:hypothetical protein
LYKSKSDFSPEEIAKKLSHKKKEEKNTASFEREIFNKKRC